LLMLFVVRKANLQHGVKPSGINPYFFLVVQ